MHRFPERGFYRLEEASRLAHTEVHLGAGAVNYSNGFRGLPVKQFKGDLRLVQTEWNRG